MKLGFLRGFVLVGLGSIAAGLVLAACKADIILPPARGLEGDYAGLLTITTPDTTRSDHVIVTLRLIDPNDPAAGTYAHRFDDLNGDTTDNVDFCNMPRGSWLIKNGKLILSPGGTDASETCDETLIPNSEIAGEGGSVSQFPFGISTFNSEPPEDDLGDSLILEQNRIDDGIKTQFRLALTAIQ